MFSYKTRFSFTSVCYTIILVYNQMVRNDTLDLGRDDNVRFFQSGNSLIKKNKNLTI